MEYDHQRIEKKWQDFWINNKTFKFNKESKENGDLYGSIKPKEITNLINQTTKAEVNPSQIILKEE